MMLDALERRRLFAGTVTVITDYGPGHRLLVQGDDADNVVTLTAGIDNFIEQEDRYEELTVGIGTRLIVDGTEIRPGKNGFTSGDNYYTGISTTLYGSPLVDLRGGNDRLFFDGDTSNAYGLVEALTGDGNDLVEGDGGFFGLKIDTGAGDERVNLESDVNGLEGLEDEGAVVSGVRGDLNVFTGSGRDRVTMTAYDAFLVRGKLRLVDNSGRTTYDLHAVRARRGATISTGNVADAIGINGCFFAKGTTIYTAGGNDIISLRRASFLDDEADVLQPGGGKNSVVHR